MPELEPAEVSAEERDGAIVRGFIPLALRTCSPNYYGASIPKQAMYRALENVVAAAELLDGLKKLMFYNKPVQPGLWGALGVPAIAEVECFNPVAERQFIDIMHGVIGSLTEGGELAECLLKALQTGDLDTTNLKEECGDDLWYKALIFNAIDTSFPIEMLRVIDKLRKRFPDKYDNDLAINRDHDAERIVLENDIAHVDVSASSEETSAEVAALAAMYIRIDADRLMDMLHDDPAGTIRDIRAISASALTQRVPEVSPDGVENGEAIAATEAQITD